MIRGVIVNCRNPIRKEADTWGGGYAAHARLIHKDGCSNKTQADTLMGTHKRPL